jgi:HAD superfamily 5'-nucleotidase-like hydrolase
MTSIPISEAKRVFVNRTLNLNSIKLIGFDMDYTLVTYDVPAFETKIYRIVIEKLIRDKGYPEAIRALTFDPTFIIRGLVIDTESGGILKVNRYGYVKRAAHGTRFLTMDEQKARYGASSIDLTDHRFYIVHTLFSLAEGCLFAQLVDYFDAHGGGPGYKGLFNDVRRGINDSHQEEALKGDVMAHPETYLIRDREIVEALKRYKRFGKRLALITNSDFPYSQKVMDYCFGPFLGTGSTDDSGGGQPRPAKPTGPGKSAQEPVVWQDLFDLVIVSSNKPSFFEDENKFLKVDPATGLLRNFHGPIEWGGIYQGGNAHSLERDLGLNPAEILYLGDHIHGDVVTLKETIGWRTGLVVQELADEVPILCRTRPLRAEITTAMAEKERHEERLLAIKEAFHGLAREQRPEALEREREQLRLQIADLDEKLRTLISAEQKDFNLLWGEVMRAGNEESRFATLVERYACIYMASIGNLGSYSPFKFFRSQRRYLAHDPMPEGAVESALLGEVKSED